MHRNAHNHSHNHSQDSQPRGRPVVPEESAKASDCFEQFLTASTLKTILGCYRNICEHLHLKPNALPLFYPKLKTHITSWKAKPLWKKFDTRANQKCYGRGKACPQTRVLIIGGGPCGLRTAIEAQLLGAKVVVVEKRDRMSRNNVLHLWPFVIDDLRALGAKKFFGKFCAGSIDHISIRQLQCILLKVALLLGVEVHTEVRFERILEPNPNEKTGWRAEFKPAEHPVSQFEFDVIIGADGKRNTLQGFKRKEFRGKLAIAITANFINKRTEAEARVEEISGVAFIFNQKFFKDLYAETGIDLENIVYYKDDTHYFVMTAKKQSLIDKGVIKEDLSDTAKLLAPDNVDREELMNYAREAAEFSTNYQMPDLEFAVNHYGHPDVAMFDFTSMYAAENASRVIERHNYKLLSILVGDSLLEPFWPTGSGCARGFLSSMDGAWAIRSWGSDTMTPLEVIAERESIYRLLAQTTPENLNKDYKSYTIEPWTRYPNLNKNVLLAHQVISLYDTDDLKSIELNPRSTPAIVEVPKKRRRESHVDPDTLLSWIKEQIREHEDLEVTNLTTSFRDGRVLCAIISHYRPDLLDYSAINAHDIARNNQVAFDLLEKELGIPPFLSGEEMADNESPDFLTMLGYLTKVYDTFRCEIPHIKYPKYDMPEVKRNENVFKIRTNVDRTDIFAAPAAPPARPSSRHKRHVDTSFLNKPSAGLSQDRKARKRRTLEKVGASVEDRQKRLEEIASNRSDRHSKRRQQRKMQTEQFLKSMQMLQSNCKPDHSEPFEDYSIYLYRQTAPNFEDRVKNLEKQFIYVPDKDTRAAPTQLKRETDEDFAARIKDLEEKWKEPVSVEKKPKDLLRAIGKIETSDWNIKEIEKKIIENKLGKSVNKDKEKVPKWSREQFLARQNKMERKHLDRQDSAEVKFAEIDKNIKQLEQKLKEGSVRNLNQHKVASITEKLVGKTGEPTTTPQPQPPPPPLPKQVQKSNSRTVIAINQGSEFCHFCSKRVYLVERLTAEGKIFHTGCFRCQYCNTSLRLGTYMFDREGLYGHRFYCAQHFGMPGEISRPEKKPMQVQEDGPQKKLVTNVFGVDLLDRVQTPERIEFSNLSTGHVSSDHDESPSPIDEDEWTDRNNINSVIDSDSSDDSSSASDTDTDDEAYEEALEEPITKEGTLRWAERYKKRYSHKDDDSNSDGYSSSDHFSYYENSSGDDDSDTATEGEEEIRARELRKQEVRVEPPIDAGTDTEVASCDTTSESSSEIQNSATEISTDSEFAHDDPTPTREMPKKIFDGFVTKTRGVGGSAYHHHHHQSQPKKVQVKSSMLQQPMNGRTPASATRDIELKFTPLVTAIPLIRKPAPSSLLFSRSNEGYALNRTQSTGGIATKVSLELKKKYLLGEMNPGGGIQKSGSASTLDSKFKSFHTNITDCQKMLKPASEISASMQAFCSKLSERTSPLSPTFGLITKEKSSPNLNLSSELLHKAGSPKMEITKCMSASSIPEIIETNVVNETEGRPRSPLHEKQIIVPVIDWFKMKQKRESDYVDSLSSDSDSDEVVVKRPHIITNIPRLEITDDSGAIVKDAEEIAFDSLNESINYHNRISINDVPKSISSERKTLNQPKILPDLENDSVLPDYHSALHTYPKITEESKANEPDSKSLKDSSGRSTPSLNDDIGTTALTETELDDFEDVEYELISDIRALNSSNEQIKNKADNLKTVGVARITDFGRDSKVNEANKSIKSTSGITECVNILSLNIDNIEFMDTGTEEASSDDNHVLKNNGYFQFHNEDDFGEDSLSPALNIIETVNPAIETFNSNAEHTASSQKLVEEDRMDSSACDLKLVNENMLDKAKLVCDNEDDSILIVETGTTTEENTCSDSTVKNITEKITKINGDQTNVPIPVVEEPPQIQSEAFEKEEDEKSQQNGHHREDFTEFEEHCQRLQSKFEFSNVKDSLDIRRTRRRSKPDISKPDLIQEEKDKAVVNENINQSSTKLSKKEEIEKERSMNQKLVQEMVMNKMRAQNKSLQRKKRVRNSFSPIRPFELSKSATTDLSRQNKDLSQLTTATTPDVLLSIITSPLQKSQSTILSDISPLKEKSPPTDEPKSESATYNLPDVSKTSTEILFQTPRKPPRKENVEARKTAEKFKESARARCRLLSDEELGLSPEDKLIKLRQKVALRKNRDSGDFDVRILDSIESLVINTDRRNSLHYSNDTLKRNTSFRRSKSGDATSMTTPNTELVAKLSIKVDSNQRSQPMRTKSVSEINRFSHTSTIDLNIDNNNVNMCKSDPNLVMPNKKHHTKKPKDRERRKSITKMIAELFTKKKDSTNSALTPSKSFLSRISPKIKNKSKSWLDLDLGKIEKIEDATLKRNSISEINLRRDSDGNVSPPPIPPLPVNYVRRHSLKDESSDAENELKHDLGSCDTLDQSDAQMASVSNCPSKKLNRSARKTARRAQLKRHRTAQEIQRKLEETEVKTRELELRGVQVEKALRGESNGSFADDSKEESDLLKEWFDLMRDRTELRRYEKELMVRAQELELEDRHARLQHELRERLENDEPKTKEEMEIERDIIKEMMEIVAKRDSLINLLEEDRLRCFKRRRSSAPSEFSNPTPAIFSDEESLHDCSFPFIALIMLLIAFMVSVFVADFVLMNLHV
ncbi:Actin binding protein [Oryctes borbonicus]|uniref:F-actin monooxygenase n=1 Tax=Oryctes borbonicus TaxID=1629725 RepID=A0A0T6BGP5_9SCAR|nr:Actin binding protein [Oryctes borbonicus]